MTLHLRHTVTLLLGTSLSACGWAADSADATGQVIEVTAASIADSMSGHLLLIRPNVEGSWGGPLSVPEPFDSAALKYVLSRHPEVSAALFARGERARSLQTPLRSLQGRRYRLLTGAADELLADSLGVAWQRLRRAYGPEAIVVGFAPPALADDEALVYYYTDELVPMGLASAYAYVRWLDGEWRVMWHLRDYVE